MWKEVLESGKVKFRERYTNPVTGQLKVVSVTMDNANRANTKLAKQLIQDKINEALMLSSLPERITLEDLVERYVDDQKKRVKQSTWFRNENCLNSVADILGRNTLVCRLTSGYIISEFERSGKKNVTLNEYLKRLKTMLKWAHKRDLLLDIAFLAKLENWDDKSKKEKNRYKYLESHEAAALLKHMYSKRQLHHAYLTELLLRTGMRVGEAIALEIQDIDLSEKTISISKTYNPNFGTVTTPKTASSVRLIGMTDECMTLIKNIIVYERTKSRCRRISKKRVLLSGIDGKYLSYDAYRQYLSDTAAAVGIPTHVTPHVLRHTCASLLMEQGLDIELISRHLGHENSKITREIYIHVTKKLAEQDRQLMQRVSIKIG